MYRKLLLAIIINALFCLCSPYAFADSKKDIETIAQVIEFMNNGPTGRVEMAVVYDPSNADSVQHANDIMSWASDGIGSKIKLVPHKVAISAVSSSNAPIFFLTRGSNNCYPEALAKAKSNNGLTVSTDVSCLGQGCVLVVQTLPRVNILVSTDAQSRTGVKFSPAFSLIVTMR